MTPRGAGAGRDGAKRIEQRGHDHAVATEQDEDGECDVQEELGEDRHAALEAGLEHVGQGQAAQLTDDLAGQLDSRRGGS